MSDSLSPPTSAISRFGTSVVGKQFEWEHETADGASTELITARTVAAVSFKDTLRYTTGRHAQLVQAARAGKEMKEALDEVDVQDPAYAEIFERIVNERLEHEEASWAAAIDIILLLVREEDRDKLRQPLIDGDPKNVNALRSWLELEVLGTGAEDAATEARVDPTLRQPPQNSASNPDSGDDSDSKASTSTP